MKQKRRHDKLHICFVAPLPPPYGGIANWMTMLCRYIDSAKKGEISYSIINTAPKKRTTEGRTLWQRIVGGGVSMIKVCRQLKKTLKSGKVDCVHITTSGHLSLIRDLAVLFLTKKYDVRAVYHIHFGRVPDILSHSNWERKLLLMNLKYCGSVIAIDRKTYHALKKSQYCDNIIYSPNPVNMEEMPEPIERKKKIISFVGWVIPAKGVEELLQAWERVSKEENGWKLQFIGPYRKEYYHMLRKHYSCKRAVFLGELPHQEALERINFSRIFVLPSYTEGFPISVLEAMALGTTVIASEVGAIPEMLSDGCGYLIEKQNVESLKTALQAAIQNDSDEYGKKAREKALRNYEIGKVVRQYEGVWKR